MEIFPAECELKIRANGRLINCASIFHWHGVRHVLVSYAVVGGRMTSRCSAGEWA